MSDERTERDQLMRVLHTGRNTVEMQALVKLCEWLIDDAKERLVSCEAAMVPMYQARAKLMREVKLGVQQGPARGPHTSRDR